ncbi:MAG: 5-(carboxyamino)imidazole ribonucleotide mutase [Actinomycetota bacterium]
MTGIAPLVGIVMGSASDLDTMAAASDVLDGLGLPNEVRILSAHRTPWDLLDYGTTAADRGLRVLIGAAGGAAHLPGMLAAVTTLPVIGVPVPSRYLAGLDSLLSIVQMPTGIPVATVAIGGAANAALLAARIIGISDPAICAAVRAHQADMADASRDSDAHLYGGATPC